MSEKQFYLLQVNDALFPIGGIPIPRDLKLIFSRGIVHDEDTAREYITHKIKWNLAYTELLAARLATKLQRKKICRNFYLEEIFWKHPEFRWNREKRQKNGFPFYKDNL